LKVKISSARILKEQVQGRATLAPVFNVKTPKGSEHFDASAVFDVFKSEKPVAVALKPDSSLKHLKEPNNSMLRQSYLNNQKAKPETETINQKRVTTSLRMHERETWQQSLSKRQLSQKIVE